MPTKLSRKETPILSATSAVVITGGSAGTAAFLPTVAIGDYGIVLGVIAKKKLSPQDRANGICLHKLWESLT